LAKLLAMTSMLSFWAAIPDAAVQRLLIMVVPSHAMDDPSLSPL
jgi:hypothetical protein